VEFKATKLSKLSTFTEYFVITWLRLLFADPLVGGPFCGGPCWAEHAEHA